MLKFSDLSEDDQAHAVCQAVAILSMEGEATIEAAQELAARAFFPEEDDPIIFLCPLLDIDLDDEVFANRSRNDQAA